MKYILLIIILLTTAVRAQINVAITMDDIPNGRTFVREEYPSRLLAKLDSLSLPVAIFINEGKINKSEDPKKKLDLLNEWAKRKYITLGNHSYSHPAYSEIGFDIFSEEVLKGEELTRKLAGKYNKSLKYFRFPFNDLGNDSIQQKQMRDFLSGKGYEVTPFTIDSSDWMFSYVYEYYLSLNDVIKAKNIGEAYIEKTLEYFDHMEAVTYKNYRRPIDHIYLCHDNAINADYLPQIIDRLKQKNHSFISLDEVLQNEPYKQENIYYEKRGISWLYRWMPAEERNAYMKTEPDTSLIEGLYNSIQKQSGKQIID